MGTIFFKENGMKIIRSAIVVVLLVGIGSGIVIANKANEGEGDCITISPSTLVLRDCKRITNVNKS